MHRGYFARSLEDNKDDPLGGKYGSSVLAAVRLAKICTKLDIDHRFLAWECMFIH